MGHDLPDLKPLIVIVDNGGDPILVAAHITVSTHRHNLPIGMFVATREKTPLNAARLSETIFHRAGFDSG